MSEQDEKLVQELYKKYWEGIYPEMTIGEDPELEGVLREAITRTRTSWNEAEQNLRYALWTSHGHDKLYGDDGEMQCPECKLFDYKNENIGQLLTQVRLLDKTRTRKATLLDAAGDTAEQANTYPVFSECRSVMMHQAERLEYMAEETK